MAEHCGRVVVGVDGSLVSLRALREAVAEARRRQTKLTVVHVRAPERPAAGSYLIGLPPVPAQWPTQDTTPSLDRAAEALVAKCIDEALGGTPPDVTLTIEVEVGTRHAGLVHQVRRDDDLLVVGTRDRGRCRHPWRPSVSKYCISHAQCPVLVVPPDSFARAIRRRRRWHRSLAGRDPWKLFDNQVVADRQHVGDA